MIKIGKKENGVFYGDCTDNGIVYKSEEAYLNRPDEICYIPEYGFSEEHPYYGTETEVVGYSHNELLKICDQNKSLCDAVFSLLDWQSPGVLLDEIDREEFEEYIKQYESRKRN
jgi:hypothetical protein